MTDRTPSRIAPAPAHRATRSVRERALLTLAALVPGAIATTVLVDPALPARLGMALLVAAIVEAAASRWTGAGFGARPLDPSSFLSAALVALVLPGPTPAWGTWTAAAVAVAIGRGLWRTAGASPFHPAMLGVALVMLALPPATGGTPWPGPWPTLAWIAGGVALVAGGVIRWPAPLAMLGVVLLGLAATAADPFEAARSALADGRVALVACFVATAPASGATTPAGRWVFGGGVALAALAAGPGRLAEALPPAVLLMNALAPLIDRWTEPVRPPRAPEPP